MTYYTYLHARPTTTDANGVFYVGKGTAVRAGTIDRKNRHHKNIVAKYGKSNILLGKIECSTESIAFELEKGLIKCLRRMGVSLTNMSDGGEGQSGYAHTDDTRKRMSETHRKMCESETRRAMLKNLASNKSKETILAISNKSKQMWADEDCRKRIIASQTKAQRNLVVTENKREVARANAVIGRERLKDPVVKAAAAKKNSELSKAMWADPVKKAEILAKRKSSREAKKRV